MALPATKINELITELGEVFDSNKSLDQFTLHRYQKDIDAIKRSDYIHGILLEAFIAGINNETQRVLSIAEEGINRANVSAAWYANMGKLLQGLGRVVEAYAMATKALQEFPTDGGFIQDVMYFAMVTDDDKAIALLREKYPDKFDLFNYPFSSLGEETPEDEAVAILSEHMPDSELRQFTPRELQSIEGLLEGVEID